MKQPVCVVCLDTLVTLVVFLTLCIVVCCVSVHRMNNENVTGVTATDSCGLTCVGNIIVIKIYTNSAVVCVVCSVHVHMWGRCPVCFAYICPRVFDMLFFL